jgi:hypothetical protein
VSSTLWGPNPSILACGHFAEPWAGFGWGFDGIDGRLRECSRCAREKGEGYRWQQVVVEAWDIDLTEDDDAAA